MYAQTGSGESETLSLAFKALGDLNRLRLFALIAARGEICVGDLVTVLDLPQSTVSRHLAALRQGRLVAAHRLGTWVHYSLNEASADRATVLALAEIALASETCADDISRAASLAAAGGCCPQHPESVEEEL